VKRIILYFSLAFNVLQLWGQQSIVDSVHRLPAYEVISSRLDEFSIGQKVRSIDTLTLQQSRSLNLGELLQRSSSLQVNAYSHNGLNTIAFRGTSVTHTGLYWNGVQLNPPNNGQVDLSLIPAGMFGDIRIYHGGGSALYGSGNIGGSIHMNSTVDFSEHLSVDAAVHMASFGEAGGFGKVSLSNGKWYAKTTIVGKAAENEFPYNDLTGAQVRLQNARLGQAGLSQDLYLDAGRGWITGVSLWLQQNRKEVPATLTSKPSDSWQTDRSLKTMVSAKKILTRGMFSIKSAVLYDYLHFMDPDTMPSLVIDSEIRTLRSVTEAQMEKHVGGNTLLNGGLSYTAERGETDYYAVNADRQQLGVFAQWRQDFIEHYQVPFTPALGFEGKVYRIVSARLNVSRNFRVPTFNDRYWVPGGNVELLPESSWNEEVSLIFDMNMEAFRNKTWMIFTAYNSNVDNWILWVPEGSIWSAENVQKVWSRGLEAEYRSAFSIGDLTIKFIGGYTYARSTNEAKQEENDNTYGKQLIYVPLHRYFFTGNVLFRGMVFSYNQARTGERYVTRDNSEKLPGFTVANVILSKEVHIREQLLTLGFEVANLWDKDYQAVQYNPMPGRNYKITAIFNFNSVNHDTTNP
jgi:iron complex outermembrane receptor protein